MYTFPFVIFLNVFTLVPIVTPQPVLEKQPESVIQPLRSTTRTYTVSTKCPTELVGIQTPSSKMYHQMVDIGLYCINLGTPIHKAEFKQVCA